MQHRQGPSVHLIGQNRVRMQRLGQWNAPGEERHGSHHRPIGALQLHVLRSLLYGRPRQHVAQSYSGPFSAGGPKWLRTKNRWLGVRKDVNSRTGVSASSGLVTRTIKGPDSLWPGSSPIASAGGSRRLNSRPTPIPWRSVLNRERREMSIA